MHSKLLKQFQKLQNHDLAQFPAICRALNGDLAEIVREISRKFTHLIYSLNSINLQNFINFFEIISSLMLGLGGSYGVLLVVCANINISYFLIFLTFLPFFIYRAKEIMYKCDLYTFAWISVNFPEFWWMLLDIFFFLLLEFISFRVANFLDCKFSSQQLFKFSWWRKKDWKSLIDFEWFKWAR